MVKIIKRLIELGEQSEKRVYGKDIPDDRDIVQQDGKVIIQKTSRAEAQEMSDAFNKVFADATTIDGREILESLDNIEIPTSAASSKQILDIIKNKNKSLFNHLKRGKVSTADMIAYAEQLGERNIIKKLLLIEPGEVTKAEDLFAGMLVVHKNLRRIEKNYKKIRDENLSDAEINKLNDEIGYRSVINKNIGLQILAQKSEAGRTLRDPLGGNTVERIISTETPSAGASIPVIKRAAKSYLALPINDRSQFLVKGGPFAKTNQVIQEIYINALLSSPVTQMVNAAANTAFQFKTLFDTAVAGTVGTIRTTAKKLLGNDPEFDEYDRVFVGEATAEFFGSIMAQRDALTLMSKTFIKGEAPDLLTKTELEELRAIGKERNPLAIAKQMREDPGGAFLSTIGAINGIPGRLLATGDEYFKVISRQRFIYKEAYKEAMTDYQVTRKAENGTSEEAIKSFIDTFTDRMDNPTEATIEGAKQSAKKMTFQQELGNSLPEKGVRKLMEISPLMRYIIPFVRTPTNVVKEALSSTIISAVHPKFYQKLKNASGREFDELVGKLVVGNGIAATFMGYALGWFGDDVRITGAGPSAKGARKYYQGAGIPQYSIGIRQEDGSYQWTSYSRFDPISGILAMSADAAYYIQNEKNPDLIQGVMNALTVSIFDYAGQLPFLQGVSDLTKAFGDIKSDPMRSVDTISKFVGQKVGNVATTIGRTVGPVTGPMQDYLAEYTEDAYFPIPPSSSSFTATLERVQDPRKSQVYRLEDLEEIRLLPSFMRGFYTALQQAKSRNPRFSNDLLPQLNFWGEELTQTEGRFDEYFNPFRRTTSREETQLEKELIDIANTSGRVFSNHPFVFMAGKERVELSAPLYNTYIKNVNSIDNRGRVFGDDGYNYNQSLIPTLENIINGEGSIGRSYVELKDPSQKFDILNAVLSTKRKEARDKLYEGTDIETQKLNFFLGNE